MLEMQELLQLPDKDSFRHDIEVPEDPEELIALLVDQDPDSHLGIIIYTLYLFCQLTSNFLPEICHLYLRRFSDEFPLERFMQRNLLNP